MDGAQLFARRDSPLDQHDDPRIGSSRDNSSSATVTGISSGSNSASISALFTTLIPVSVYVGVCLVLFITFRRKCPRVYAPRTFLSSLHPYERTAPLPGTWFTWFGHFWRVPDTYVLNHSSVDGFLFLRFLGVLRNICLLDRLTFGNVKHPSWFFAHGFVAWAFFAFVLYTVCRECIYAINLRQAYLLSPFYANRLSSRTVLFTCVPEQLLDEAKLRKVFGDSVKNVWIPKTSWELERLVRERDQTAARLQDAELELINKANLAWRRIAKNGHPDIANPNEDLEHGPVEQQRRDTATTPTGSTGSKEGKPDWQSGFALEPVKFGPDGPPFDVPGSIAAQWIPQEDRPVHRPIANFCRRVDTIRWTRKRLKKLGKEIAKVRKRVNRGDTGSSMPSAFIEFTSQNEAQIAYQSLAHHRPSHMSQRYIGVRPYEIIWFSLRMRWWERIIRRFGILTATALMTIFWSIPCAFVGMTSNIKYLATIIPFLGWIEKLPQTLIGFLTGLLPAFALSLLMAIVPGILRVLARAAGVPSQSLVELFTQRAYFGFQVLQVFLVTTFTSSASASISQVIKNPMSARELLAESLPKASNFYLSYMIIQCLGNGAGQLVHLSGLFKYHIVQRFTRNPKIMYTRWHRMRRVHWGGIMPVFINLGVIALSYSVIAPIILGFTALGCSIMHLVYKYNILYVFASEYDTRGLSYILALKQLLTGLYLAEVCLLGLFALKLAFGPVVMMFISITVTAVVHISLDEAVGPLLENLPRTLSGEKASDIVPDEPEYQESVGMHPGFGDLPFDAPYLGVLPFETPDLEDQDPVIHVENGTRNGNTMSRSATPTTSSGRRSRSWSDADDNDDSDAYDSDASSTSSRKTHKPTANTRALEGAEGLAATTFTLLKMLALTHIRPSSVSTDDHHQQQQQQQQQEQEQQQQQHPPSKPSIAAKTTSDALAAATKATALLSTLVSPTPPPPCSPPLPFLDRLKHGLLAFLHPEIYTDYARLAALLPADMPDVRAGGERFADAYASPAMVSGAPRVWVPDDGAAAACGRQEAAHTGAVTGVVRLGAARMDARGAIEVDLDEQWEELVVEGDRGGGGGKKTWLRDGELDWGRWRWW
ncbi:protein of unknown function DUF221 [Macrophomina phaseolina MS6]|uniref:DUF221-domain-containing protein n=1 Tax=Macrophomina phaseolina (strain MS6) TaxID=1126212 RepID=K2RBE5_MACPH|nr:protein of unknown function DUF221 [Macrophomina phaseolina MS6]